MTITMKECFVFFQANKTLIEENEELNAQLLARAVHEGKHMLQEGSSLADELDHLTKEEVFLKPSKHQSRLQQTTLINTFSLFYREIKT